MSAVTSTFAVAGAARLGSSALLRGKAIRATARGASVAPARGATLRVNADGTDHAPRPIARIASPRRVAVPTASPAARPSARRDVTPSETSHVRFDDRRDPRVVFVSFSFRALSARAATAAPS